MLGFGVRRVSTSVGFLTEVVNTFTKEFGSVFRISRVASVVVQICSFRFPMYSL